MSREAFNGVLQEIARYEDLPSGYQGIVELIDIQKNLAIHSFRLAATIGKAQKDYNRAYALRKIRTAEQTVRNAEDMTQGLAAAQAIVDCKDLRIREADLEGSYLGGKLTLQQANKVLQALTQDIANLRQEAAQPYNNP